MQKFHPYRAARARKFQSEGLSPPFPAHITHHAPRTMSRVEIEFVWRPTPGEMFLHNVVVRGSWDRWRADVPLAWNADRWAFIGITRFYPGVYEFKFLLNGWDWKCSPDFNTKSTTFSTNNTVHLLKCVMCRDDFVESLTRLPGIRCQHDDLVCVVCAAWLLAIVRHRASKLPFSPACTPASIPSAQECGEAFVAHAAQHPDINYKCALCDGAIDEDTMRPFITKPEHTWAFLRHAAVRACADVPCIWHTLLSLGMGAVCGCGRADEG